MNNKSLNTILLFSLFFTISPAWSCTNLLITKGASSDGSVMITYTCDGEFHPRLRHTPAQDHTPDEPYLIQTWGGKTLGQIPQPEHTYAVYGLMNENQVAIAETTFDGRLELQNKESLLHYWELMKLALQRSKTAREAIHVITTLVEEYGYRSTGESFSIADKEEAWIMEMIGKGPKNKGAVWVAVKVPDGKIAAHANAARIGTFPMDDPENCLYAKDVVSFAVEKGIYDPKKGEPFRFNEAYCPVTPQKLRYTETRVWSLFRRSAPSQNFPEEFHRGKEGASRYPLWIEPDQKLSLSDVMSLMRDHYEGTAYDMTKGVDAGPFNTPNRWRPMNWRVEGKDDDYTWERPISTQQTGFSFISQSRSFLPDPIGGVFWYGLDDTYTTVYMPFYCGVDQVPETLSTGSLSQFDRDSAWWVFNYVANIANLKYSYMIKDIQKVQSALEGDFLEKQPVVEKIAMDLYKTNPELMQRYLTDYSVSHSETVVKKWLELGDFLMTKYNDGYIQNERHNPQEVSYPAEWLKKVLESRPEQFKLPKRKQELETKLSY